MVQHEKQELRETVPREQSCGSAKGEGKAREPAQEGRDRVRGRIQNPQSEECGPRTQQGWSTGVNGKRRLDLS